MTTAPNPPRGKELLLLFTKARYAFWRCDVDVSLGAAVSMARFAHLSGIRATFYFMLRSPCYNLLSEDGGAAIETVRALGHEVGLHVDYRMGSVERVVQRDQAIAAAAFPGWLDPELVSFHMPPKAVLWRDFEGFVNAYAAKWEGRYLSDARGEWPPEKTERVANDMQVALHPEYWMPEWADSCDMVQA